jgi:hypothetical protein
MNDKASSILTGIVAAAAGAASGYYLKNGWAKMAIIIALFWLRTRVTNRHWVDAFLLGFIIGSATSAAVPAWAAVTMSAFIAYQAKGSLGEVRLLPSLGGKDGQAGPILFNGRKTITLNANA